MKRHTLYIALFALATIFSPTSPVSAQETDSEQAAMNAALDTLKEKLSGISDDVFLREQKLDNGARFFQLIWEMNGETSKFTFELRRLGQFSGKPMFGILAYTVVAETEKGSMPPAVIKAVATKNEKTGLGYFSMTENFDTVYMNFTAPSDTLTSGQLWMICAWMHQNRIDFKGEIGTILEASGR